MNPVQAIVNEQLFQLMLNGYIAPGEEEAHLRDRMMAGFRQKVLAYLLRLPSGDAKNIVVRIHVNIPDTSDRVTCNLLYRYNTKAAELRYTAMAASMGSLRKVMFSAMPGYLPSAPTVYNMLCEARELQAKQKIEGMQQLPFRGLSNGRQHYHL